MKIHYYGHSALGIEVSGKYILVDPFISGNPQASTIDVDSLRADYVVLTHAHFDHILDVECIVDRTHAQIIANHEIATWYNTHKKYDSIGMNHGGTVQFDFGSLKAVNAIHSSSFPDGTYGGNPMGFVLKSEDKVVYIAGDTALTWDMKLIPMFYRLDLAILPVGGNFTMDVDEAVIAASFVECNKIMGIHYDTMPQISINHDEAKTKFSKQGKELHLLKIGESLSL